MREEAVLLGDRLSYDGELCTVRFIGELPAWPGITSYGVEWDNIEKGKHDGTYKNNRYFHTTDGAKRGSFLKSSKETDEIKGFYTALVQKYGEKVEEREIRIGKKVVETYGFQKLQILQSDFHYLKNISLSRNCVRGKVLDSETELIRNGLRNLRELDLSFNLFVSLTDVLSILECLSIVKLNLTGNLLTKVTDKIVISSLKSLNLTMTYSSKEVLDSINQVFPNLEALYLSDNKLTKPPIEIAALTNLNQIDFSMNDIGEIPSELSKNPGITNVNLGDNLISIKSSSVNSPNILKLDIRRNEIKSWKEIVLLNEQFPNVIELRINGNPLYDGKKLEEVEYIIIAMLRRVKVLNGVEISEQERINSELYFLSRASIGDIEYSQDNFERLAKKHGKVTNKVTILKNNIGTDLLKLKVKHADQLVELEIVQTLEFLRLRGIISRVLQMSILDFQISYHIGTLKQILDNDMSLISSFEFEQGQLLVVEDV